MAEAADEIRRLRGQLFAVREELIQVKTEFQRVRDCTCSRCGCCVNTLFPRTEQPGAPVPETDPIRRYR